MGIARAIEPSGGIFPSVSPDAPLTWDELAAGASRAGNHDSFTEKHGEATPPAVDLVKGYVNQGFARLCADRGAAETWLKTRAYPAPLGNVTRDTGTGLKHRVIQDLRVNGVNSVVRLPERQTLPRPLDHALDAAALRADVGKNGLVASFVLDVKDAFMSVPLHPDEMAFNCAELPEDMALERRPLDGQEARKGKFLIWRVLGFGGRPNPLVFR